MLSFTSQLDFESYDNFAKNHPYNTLLQSGNWPKIKHNWKPFYTGVFDDDNLIATALVLIRDLPLGFKFAYIPRGPLMDYSKRPLVEFYLKQLKELAKKEKCLFVKMDPAICYRRYQLADKDFSPVLDEGQTAINTLIDAGAKHLGLPVIMHDSFQPRYVAITTLDENHLNNFPKKTQKAVKYVKNRRVHVEKGHKELLDELVAMIELTEDRKNINLRDKDYFKLFLDHYKNDCSIYLATINPKENYTLFSEEISKRKKEIELIKDKSPKKVHHLNEQIASYEKMIKEIEENKDQDRIVMASLLSVTYGKTVELLYAGTDIKYSRFYPQEAIYTTIMNEGKDQGLLYCNMGGIEGTLDDGLTLFKSGFDPYINEYIGEFDLPTSPLYKGFNLAWKLRTKLKEKKNR